MKHTVNERVLSADVVTYVVNRDNEVINRKVALKAALPCVLGYFLQKFNEQRHAVFDNADRVLIHIYKPCNVAYFHERT